MCGFAGYLELKPSQLDPSILKKMGDAILHRGPDAEGIWHDNNVNIALVHRRLAIQDLSPAGAQPMVSRSGRFVIAFNGEIYNFLSLRKELQGLNCTFRGQSDTEVILTAFEQWGVQASLEKFAGMFAFACIDLRDKKLYLCRDRIGEKPLYYGWQGTTLLFASELKALRCHPCWLNKINSQALPLLLRHNFIPYPQTIYDNIYKLPPASLLTFDFTNKEISLPEPDFYWQLSDQCSSDWQGDITQAGNQLDDLLSKVIAEQMISDVPLGAFLSGGIDSSVIIALMQKQSDKKVKTFSIGFDEPGYNEAIHAKAVAEHLKTEHTELYITANDALNVIPSLPKIYDEPFADSSQIPTFLVSKMTSQHVTVALSGDGGDELFCGYTRYFQKTRDWQKKQKRLVNLYSLLAKLPTSVAATIIKAINKKQKARSKTAINFRLAEHALINSTNEFSDYYRQSVSYWSQPELLLKNAYEPEYALTQGLPKHIKNDLHKALMWLDLNWYLPDDILTKVDRAAMACSLETRVPMLDHRIVNFALGLPTNLNIADNEGKQVLRNVLYRYVPKSLVDRPKQGFAIPISHWLRTSLRDWAEDLLDLNHLNSQNLWHADTLRWFWDEHLSGREDYSFKLWGILMFQAWLKENPS